MKDKKAHYFAEEFNNERVEL